MTENQSQFVIIENAMTHLGDDPTSLFGNFEGDLYWRHFTLPENVDSQEYSVIICRTFNNQQNTKGLYINLEKLGNILEPHPNNRQEWMMDIAVLPKGLLKPGENSIHICFVTCSNNNFDDFVFDNMVLWYKTLKTTMTLTPLEKEVWLKKVNAFTKKMEIDTKKLKALV